MLQFGGISPIFRGPFLQRVARHRHVSTLLELGDYFSGFCPPDRRQPLREWFDFFYNLLSNKYRCEYIYKNAIATKLYLGGHHCLQNSLLTDELRSGKSRADVVILNGTSTVYEVKSGYDSLGRLDTQLADYRRVFDHIVVVTTPKRAPLVTARIDGIVGVMSLDASGKLAVVKKSSSNKANTDPAAVFDCMRQSEFCAVIKETFGHIPEVPNSRIYREVRELFCQLDPSLAHDLMVKRVRMRGKRKSFVELVNNAPESLKHACLSFSQSQTFATRIKEGLAEPLLT